jgi:hypothetical protein
MNLHESKLTPENEKKYKKLMKLLHTDVAGDSTLRLVQDLNHARDRGDGYFIDVINKNKILLKPLMPEYWDTGYSGPLHDKPSNTSSNVDEWVKDWNNGIRPDIVDYTQSIMMGKIHFTFEMKEFSRVESAFKDKKINVIVSVDEMKSISKEAFFDKIRDALKFDGNEDTKTNKMVIGWVNEWNAAQQSLSKPNIIFYKNCTKVGSSYRVSVSYSSGDSKIGGGVLNSDIKIRELDKVEFFRELTMFFLRS